MTTIVVSYFDGAEVELDEEPDPGAPRSAAAVASFLALTEADGQVAKNTLSGRAGIVTGGGEQNGTRNATSCSPTPHKRDRHGGTFEGWRDRQQPAHAGADRTRCPAISVRCRRKRRPQACPARCHAPRLSRQGRRERLTGPGKATGDSMAGMRGHPCGLCDYYPL